MSDAKDAALSWNRTSAEVKHFLLERYIGVMSAKKILVICFDNIGDLVFSSALFPPLKEAFPDAHLGIWCKRYTASLAPLGDRKPSISPATPSTGITSSITRDA